VPTYSNAFPDWDTEEWIDMNSPYIPSFLKLAVIVFMGALISTAIYAWRKNNGNPSAMVVEEEKSSWL
jgi:hypothetical protein